MRRSGRAPWVTWALLGANVAIFILELQQGPQLKVLLHRFGVVPSEWLVSGVRDLLDWPRLFLTLLTSQFLHGGLLHLTANLAYLWIFGDGVEDRLGHLGMLLLYVVSGIAAAVVHMLVSPNSSIPMVGASGAIAGLLGAYLLGASSRRVEMLIPFGRVRRTVGVPALALFGLWVLLQWATGLMSIGVVADVGGIAFWAHLGGLVCGMIGVVALSPRRPGEFL